MALLQTRADTETL